MINSIRKLPYTKKELLGIALVITFFAVAQYGAKQYEETIRGYIGTDANVLGMLIYGMIAIIAIVMAPISSLPLVPIVAVAWGSFTTVVVTVVAWTAGSIIAFLLARTYGRRVIGKVVDMENMRRLESVIGEKDMFVMTLLLRMVIPVDILSYALGIFSTIRFVPYVIATLIGIVPFTIFFAYAIWIPWQYQIAVAAGVIGGILYVIKKRLAANMDEV